MPNRVHLILTPQDGEGLALALSRAHRLYAGFVNACARQTGHYGDACIFPLCQTHNAKVEAPAPPCPAAIGH
jgi:hypothetical protein